VGSDAVGSHPGFFAEIGPTPRRDRSYSASRSVEFRVEIGPGLRPNEPLRRRRDSRGH